MLASGDIAVGAADVELVLEGSNVSELDVDGVGCAPLFEGPVVRCNSGALEGAQNRRSGGGNEEMQVDGEQAALHPQATCENVDVVTQTNWK